MKTNKTRLKSISKVKELCDLVKVCGDAGVLELVYGDTRVIFEPKAKGTNQSSETETVVTREIKQQPEHEINHLMKDTIDLKEDQLSMALIENPADYERLVLSGDLEDDGEETQA